MLDRLDIQILVETYIIPWGINIALALAIFVVGCVLKSRIALVAVAELAGCSVNFNVRPWVKPADYRAVYYDLTELVKLAFDEAGVSISYPQMDVHLNQPV